MALHLLNAGRLARKLAADQVSPAEQAAYFAATGIVWLATSYLLRLPPLFGSTDSFLARGLWYGEFVMLVLINWTGAFYCLRQCAREPRRHFLVDLVCLSAPATIWALALTWPIYYAAIWGYSLVDAATPDGTGLPASLFWKIHDLLLYFIVAGQVALTYLIAGRYMRRAALSRAQAA